MECRNYLFLFHKIIYQIISIHSSFSDCTQQAHCTETAAIRNCGESKSGIYMCADTERVMWPVMVQCINGYWGHLCASVSTGIIKSGIVSPEGEINLLLNEFTSFYLFKNFFWLCGSSLLLCELSLVVVTGGILWQLGGKPIAVTCLVARHRLKSRGLRLWLGL